MKKKIITLIISVIVIAALSGCSKPDDYDDDKYKTELIDCYSDIDYNVCYDKETGVMYYYTGYKMTPLYNADGSLKNYYELKESST